jgi:hypothetical protein
MSGHAGQVQIVRPTSSPLGKIRVQQRKPRTWRFFGVGLVRYAALRSLV